jgi:FKBP-type peptidyl-prolyl cis-trans isomerase 2
MIHFSTLCVFLLLMVPFGSTFVSSNVPFSRKTGSSTEVCMSPTPGAVVTIECRLIPEGDFVPEPLFDGIFLNKSAPPQKLAFVLGGGNYLPGLHDLIATMEEGETKEDVSLDAGWGAWNPNMQASMTLESLKGSGLDPEQIMVGVELVMANGVTAMVTEVTETEFTIDANPPLAGASYLADVKLLKVDSGRTTELEYAPKAGEDSKYQVASFALGR